MAKKNPNVSVIQRVVPIIAPNSKVVDAAVLASYFQGKFGAFQAAILRSKAQETIDPTELAAIARSVGLDLRQLSDDMGKPIIKKQLTQNLRAFHKTGHKVVPLVVIYNKANPDNKITLVGLQNVAVLQQAINKLNNKGNSHG